MTMTLEQAESAGTTQDVAEQMRRLGDSAKAASTVLSNASTESKNAALQAAAAAIRSDSAAILEANAKDLAAAEAKGVKGAFLDRLKLDEGRVEAMAAGLESIAELPDPVGSTIAEWTRPNGLRIARVRVPLGVIGIIYESRPNVTADAGGLCLKSGNAAILRGGSEGFHSSTAIAGRAWRRAWHDRPGCRKAASSLSRPPTGRRSGKCSP